MKEKLFFPKGFLWGSGTSSEQIEPNGLNQQANKALNIFKNDYLNRGEMYFENRYAVNNFFERYEEDLQIAKDLNFNSIRLSVSWALLQPKENCELDKKAIDYYKKVFCTARNKGLKLTVTLIHFDLPMWVANKGGWASRDVVDNFYDFAKKVFAEFDELVDYWAAFNESFAATVAVYLFDKQPQFKGTDDVKNYPKAVWNIAVATAMAVKAHKETGAKAEIGSIFVASNIYAKTNSKEDEKSRYLAEAMVFRVYSDPSVKGEFPEDIFQLWLEDGWIDEDFRIDEDFILIKNNTVKWLGVNYYLPIRVHAPSENSEVKNPLLNKFKKYFIQYNEESNRFNFDRGWEIYPRGIHDRFKQIKEYYDNIPVMVTEVGIGVANENRFRDEKGVIQDKYRIQFHSEHIYWTHKAIEEGCNIIGYQMWTYIDNWSFVNAYKNRYGFIELDLETCERKEKLSASWIREVAGNNSLNFDINIKKDEDEILKL